MALEGGCLCGALRYEADADPGLATHCHCLDCRRSAGAPMLTWVEVPSSNFRWRAGDPKRHSVRPGVTREFCGDCGTQLTYRNAEREGEIDLTVASLDRPEDIEPQDHLWFSRALRWLKPGDGLPRYDTRRE